MQFVKIENRVKVVPSANGLCLLGSSSSRGQGSKIGQFGSGFPYSLALLARNGLLKDCKLCLGKDVYTFILKEHRIVDSGGGEREEQEIVLKKQNGGTYGLNISTEFGAIDWREVTMAVREFISNACDGADEYDGTYGSVSVEIVDEVGCRAKDGFVRMFIPLNEELEEYVANINNNFICLRKTYDKNKVVFPATGPNTKIYRRGVLVGEFNRGLFNYNFNDIDLNECRVVQRGTAVKACQEAIKYHATMEQVAKFLDVVVLDPPAEKELWEQEFSEWTYDFTYTYNDRDRVSKEKWDQAANKSFNGKVICSNEYEKGIAESKGHVTVELGPTWARMMKSVGVRSVAEVVNVHDLAGRTIVPASDNLKLVFNKIWGWLEGEGLNLGKDKPGIMCFVQNTLTSGSAGYYDEKEKCIYVRKDYADDPGMNSHNIILEELAHHVTGARDCTRDFQEYAFKCAGLLLSRI